ncbi:MAG: flagellar filament capping protein FliD [Deltaproteobacteria bacterium]|nr:flagellar filament capping protein FliD [Deltaproteobacteria bacterium]MBW2343007.1 flagellar filament capping protein FliD [Deltaproteobacteria bacterium]
MSTNLVAGLSSGFDWRTMIDQLIAVEHRRVDLVEDRKKDYETELSEWQTFNTSLLALKTAAEGLKDPADFYLYTPSMTTNASNVDGEDILTVSTGSDAAPGTYTIKVTNLATAQKLSSNPFTSQTAELGSSYAGDIIMNGNVVTINATDSLADVAYSINNANAGTDPSGVTASIVNYGTNDYRLILTSDTTGEEGISLLNGSSTNLVQKFGWKDNQAAQVKNSITGGAQGDGFTAPNVAVKTLLGLAAGEASTGTLTIGGTAVTINLSTMSLTDIKTAINDAAISGVNASVISQTVDGNTYYRLQIDGTQTFVDEKNILNTLGILDHNSADVIGKSSCNSMTTEGAYITSTTLLKDIDGYNTFTAGGSPGGDYITLSGTDTAGGAVGPVDFDISSSTTVQGLLDEIETHHGNVIAYVTSDGKIRVDDLSGGSSLVVNLADHIHDANSSLEFVELDGNFETASTRQREISEGGDAAVEIDGVEVTGSTNIFEDVIAGVTLNLAGEDDTTIVSLKVERDINTIKSNISDFVGKYNGMMTYINAQFAYDEAAEETGGPLFGDSTLRSVKSDFTSLITQSIWGVESGFSSLGLVGINMGSDLILSVDDSILTGYLQTNFNDVKSLFVGQGTASNSNVSYVGHSRDSEAGEYDVHINRAATRGSQTGNVNLSAGGADETLIITQGNSTAEITITNGMNLDDITNEINAELDAEYAQLLVGNEQLYSDNTQTSKITSETTWSSVYDDGGTSAGLQNNDVITFTGTSPSGSAVSGSYTISDITTDTIQGFLSAIADAFSSDVTVAINTDGKIVLTDKYVGNSHLSLEVTEPPGRDLDFGTVLTSNTGGQEGRSAMSITATGDGNNLVLRSNNYGSTSFAISQDASDNNYDHILYSTTGNTTDSSSGTVYITNSTTWNDVYGANVATNDTITISGKARNGTTDISGTYTINNLTSDSLDGLLTAIENAFSNQGTTVDAFIMDGRIYVEDTTTGSSSISLTLTTNNEGGGSLAVGAFDQTTERDLDLGLINITVTGLDVAGTIGGESAGGSGRLLTCDDDNVNTDGLAVSYTGSSNSYDAGTVKLTLGVAEMFERTLFGITDLYDGYLAFKQDSIQGRINDLDDQVEQMEDRLDRRMEMMINRFVAMELALSKIQNQSDWLAGQINASFGGWGL